MEGPGGGGGEGIVWAKYVRGGGGGGGGGGRGGGGGGDHPGGAEPPIHLANNGETITSRVLRVFKLTLMYQSRYQPETYSDPRLLNTARLGARSFGHDRESE